MRIAKTAGINENLHSNENEIYKFLECEQVEKKIVMKKEMEIQMEQRKRKLVGEGLYDKNLVKAINCGVISVVGYMINICNFRGKELDQLDK